MMGSLKHDKSKAAQQETLMEELLKVEGLIDELEGKYGKQFRQNVRKMSQPPIETSNEETKVVC
jgi:hypothetical protein